MPDINIDNVEYTIEINPLPTYEIELNAQGPQGLTGAQGPIGPQGPKGETGDVGPKGDKGDKGDRGDTGAKGDKGDAATITVGTTTTGLPGTNASVTNSGTTSDAIINFTIPRGDKGEQGIQGKKGDTGEQGPQGEKGEKGDTGATGPQGPQGIQGETGPQGPQGVQGEQGIQGIPGVAATIDVGTVTTGAAGTNVIITNSGTSQDAVFNFTVPRGDTGSTGPQGPTGPTGATGNGIDNIALISTVGLQKTYRITYTNGSYYDYVVTDGAAGATTWGGISGVLSNQTDLQTALNGKQATLVSGTNIKTVNGNSLLGSGDITIQSGASYSATCPAITPVDGVATWSVTHNLGTQAVVTALYSNGNKIEHNTLVTSNNAITVTFKASSAVTAGSYKIVVLASGGSGGGSADDTYTSATTNVNIVGSLTNNQGVLSNFSSTNYATLPSNFAPGANPWEIVIKIHTANEFNGNPDYICSSYQDPCIVFNIAADRVISFSIGSGSGWVFTGVKGTTVLNTNTDYWAKLEFTGTQYKSYLSTDGITFSQEAVYDSTATVPSYPLNLGVPRDLYSVNITRGSIDLNGCYVNINGSRWWTGADFSELEDLSPVTDYYISGSSWYKETFSDATRTKRIWLEQGGVANSSIATINLLKSFSNADYVVTGGASNKTTSSFTLTSNANWVAIGV